MTYQQQFTKTGLVALIAVAGSWVLAQQASAQAQNDPSVYQRWLMQEQARAQRYRDFQNNGYRFGPRFRVPIAPVVPVYPVQPIYPGYPSYPPGVYPVYPGFSGPRYYGSWPAQNPANAINPLNPGFRLR